VSQVYQAYLNQPFTISCTAWDPDVYPGIGLTYSWTQVSGPDTAVFSANNVLAPTIVADTVGQYVFQLTVTDSITPVSASFIVNVLPLFTATAPYTAYCPTGAAGTPVPFTATASSASSQTDALSKATTAASVAANAALVCTPYAPLPKLQINLYGVQQIDPSVTQLQLSYLSAGTPTAPITETPLGIQPGFSTVTHPLAYVNSTIANPNNLLWPYSTSGQLSIDDTLVALVPNAAPLYLIFRAGGTNPAVGGWPFPIALYLDKGPSGASIASVTAAGNVAAAPNACLVLPSARPGPVNVSLQFGTFIGFDTANWKPAASPATHLLVYLPQGPLNAPTGLAPAWVTPMDRPSVPALAEVIRLDTLFTAVQLAAPLFLVFYAATFDPGSGVYTAIPNSIQFASNTVFSASASAPPNSLTPYSILSMSGNAALNIPAATNGVLYFPNPRYARVVAGMSTIA
jgi:hypothetical protein